MIILIMNILERFLWNSLFESQKKIAIRTCFSLWIYNFKRSALWRAVGIRRYRTSSAINPRSEMARNVCRRNTRLLTPLLGDCLRAAFCDNRRKEDDMGHCAQCSLLLWLFLSSPTTVIAMCENLRKGNVEKRPLIVFWALNFPTIVWSIPSAIAKWLLFWAVKWTDSSIFLSMFILSFLSLHYCV